MKKMTRMVLITAIFVTSGLTAKIANENYKAVVTSDERIHKTYELAKKPNKAAVLEAIVDATNAESDERIQNAVIIDPEEPKTPRVVRVITSAGVSPIVSTMDKKPVNKDEEFIEKVAHPAEVVMEKKLNFTTDNIPVQELTYETKDIFPTFEEVAEEEGEKEIPLTYEITLGDGSYGSGHYYIYKAAVNDYWSIRILSNRIILYRNSTNSSLCSTSTLVGALSSSDNVSWNDSTGVINYESLEGKTDNWEWVTYDGVPVTYADIFNLFKGIEEGTVTFVEEL